MANNANSILNLQPKEFNSVIGTDITQMKKYINQLTDIEDLFEIKNVLREYIFYIIRKRKKIDISNPPDTYKGLKPTNKTIIDIYNSFLSNPSKTVNELVEKLYTDIMKIYDNLQSLVSSFMKQYNAINFSNLLREMTPYKRFWYTNLQSKFDTIQQLKQELTNVKIQNINKTKEKILDSYFGMYNIIETRLTKPNSKRGGYIGRRSKKSRNGIRKGISQRPPRKRGPKRTLKRKSSSV
jgi:predicted transcriptional regulator